MPKHLCILVSRGPLRILLVGTARLSSHFSRLCALVGIIVALPFLYRLYYFRRSSVIVLISSGYYLINPFSLSLYCAATTLLLRDSPVGFVSSLSPR